MSIIKTFYNNSDVPMFITLEGNHQGTPHLPAKVSQLIHSKETLTLSVPGTYIMKLEYSIHMYHIGFSMILKSMGQESEVTSLLKHEKFVLNYWFICNKDTYPTYKNCFPVSIIPMI
ncbi:MULTISPECIES: hypothetical protein [Xenorhabdus]|uniref:Uncharacterized protein n=1 Tax=Xenorhabdus ehlersii TaxID=290111 RepID=A0A2D0IWK9_9GAMM|nr:MULTISPECIES: hypothetical protein [Xenorhabdus]MBC8950362.1 hypothetical protein [Xenorhabdus sp. TS4]PHM26323.1 hypothetical protein Xehl_00655 [Xenorhabdus ehlersii]RKE91572.1 hypothetical protein BDE27_1828 [Xenorhabdus ehlersii]